MDRDRKHFLAYVRYLAKRDPNGRECDFCNPDKASMKIKEVHTHFYVSYNTFPYSQWELRAVKEHLLLIPKRHMGSVSKLSDAESKEFAALLGHYESIGYDIFARTASSTTRSVIHQHTHLIQTAPKRARGVFFWRKPYILWLFR